MRSKPILFSILVTTVLFSTACQKQDSPKGMESNDPVPVLVEEDQDELRHMVVFKFKDESSEEDVANVHNAFLALPDSIPEIKHFEWGLNNSIENLNMELTHCYMLTFHSKQDLDSVYLPHPAHQAFVSALRPHLDKVFVFDYWAK